MHNYTVNKSGRICHDESGICIINYSPDQLPPTFRRMTLSLIASDFNNGEIVIMGNVDIPSAIQKDFASPQLGQNTSRPMDDIYYIKTETLMFLYKSRQLLAVHDGTSVITEGQYTVALPPSIKESVFKKSLIVKIADIVYNAPSDLYIIGNHKSSLSRTSKTEFNHWP